MRVVDLIAKKRDGFALSEQEIQFLISGIGRGDIPDYQIAAWLMAVYLRGMTGEETAALTLAMAHSGEILDLSDVKSELSARRGAAPQSLLIADKHSTGGVGDKTTITLAPLVAACGVPVGKMSGRGLGHTGGTLDKLESIPGFSCDLGVDDFKRNLLAIGIVIAGQTHALAPADGRLYALRDVTATVASVPLIASSVMSKKIAAGADAIVLDVKVGRGAFMQTEAEAQALASMMVQIGGKVGRKVSAVIADMSQPLGYAVGNALEVQEAIAALKPQATSCAGSVAPDYREHCLTLAAQMLVLVGRARDAAEGKQTAEQAIESGQALEKFRAWIRAQGGNPGVADDPSLLPQAPLRSDVLVPQDGHVLAIDALAVGLSAMRLGAGRQKKGDSIDHAVGIVLHKKIGDRVRQGEPLLTIHANDTAAMESERIALTDAFRWSVTPVEPPAHIHRVIGG